MEDPRARTLTEMARYRRQCLAVGGRNVRRAAKHSRPGRSSMAASSRRSGRSTRPSCRSTRSPRSSSSGCCSTTTWRSGRRWFPFLGQADARAVGRFSIGQATIPAAASGMPDHGLPDGNADLLPVRVRRDHGDHPRRLGARTHELHGLDDLLPAVDDAVLYRRGIQPVGRRMARQHGGGRLLGRLRHPSCRRHLGLRRRGHGRPAPATGPRAFPAQQPADDAGRRRHPVARLERVQRR